MDSINKREYIEEKIKTYLSEQQQISFNFYNTEPRVIGDFIEKLIKESFGKLFFDIIKIYKSEFSRRAMEDIAFYDEQNNYYAIDIKTYRVNDSGFNMPNLVSIKVLNDFYRQSQSNHFIVLRVDYKIKDNSQIEIKDVSFLPIEFYDWSCLRIGSLGWGQIQIKNSARIKTKESSKKEWMLNLCSNAVNYYRNEVAKIENGRIDYFTESIKFWKNIDCEPVKKVQAESLKSMRV